MAERRLPSTPPNLPGFSFVRVLGSGGFADVFLYEQNMPRRQVAIKVLLSEVVNDQVRQMFRAEANLMAQLSAHPSIMTVYMASVAADGRPYLVMEYCSAQLNERYRAERLPVPEVLSIAIRVASALETAHRAGVLHRDVKPGNILTTAYAHPVLADFGIAASLAEADRKELVGLSVPWTAPEVLSGESSGSVASEIWAMAATVYSLLAGRSPFEREGENNANGALLPRIEKARMTPLPRADAPPRLVELLSYAMAKRPESRPRSMLEFIHELQAVEAELGVAQTPIEVAMDDWALATLSHPEEQTLVRVGLGGGVGRRKRRPVYAAPVTDFTVTGPARVHQAAQERRQRGRRTRAVLLSSLAVLVGLGAIATYFVLDSQQSGIPVVSDIEVQVVDGLAQFRWPDPGLRSTDSYQVRTADGSRSVQSTTEYQVRGEAGQRVCITVIVNRQGTAGSPSRESCVEF